MINSKGVNTRLFEPTLTSATRLPIAPSAVSLLWPNPALSGTLGSSKVKPTGHDLKSVVIVVQQDKSDLELKRRRIDLQICVLRYIRSASSAIMRLNSNRSPRTASPSAIVIWEC